jgi:hypothetical protein
MRSNLPAQSQITNSILPPPAKKFDQNHLTKQRYHTMLIVVSTPEYPDVKHDVAVGRQQRTCFILPVAFVGGMGG